MFFFAIADVVDKKGPLGKCITLTVSSINPLKEETSDAEETPRSPSVPLYLRRFEGQVYAVSTKRTTIGSSESQFFVTGFFSSNMKCIRKMQLFFQSLSINFIGFLNLQFIYIYNVLECIF